MIHESSTITDVFGGVPHVSNVGRATIESVTEHDLMKTGGRECASSRKQLQLIVVNGCEENNPLSFRGTLCWYRIAQRTYCLGARAWGREGMIVNQQLPVAKVANKHSSTEFSITCW